MGEVTRDIAGLSKHRMSAMLILRLADVSLGDVMTVACDDQDEKRRCGEQTGGYENFRSKLEP